MKPTLILDDKALMKKLRNFPERVQAKVLANSVRDGATAVRNDAKKNAPVDKGLMKSKVRIQRGRKNSKLGNLVYIVNVNSPAHHLIELGTKDRTAKGGGKLAFTGADGREIFIEKVSGVKATPFLGQAYENNRENVVNKFKERLAREIKRF
jgi:HK97 gp10 family phage protein